MTSEWASPSLTMGASETGRVLTAAPALGHSGGRLSTIECLAQSLALGPVFSATVLGVLVAEQSGGVGPFVMVMTTIGVLGLGSLVSELARRISGSGTVYEYVAHTLGRRPALFTAGAYHLGAIALFTGIPIVGGILLKEVASEHFGVDPPWWVAALIVLVITIGLNLTGVQLAVRTQLVLVAAAIVPFVILVIAIVVDGGPAGNTADVFNPATVNDTGSVFDGLLIAILMFVGFELSAALGEETARPGRSIPAAMLGALLISGAFYVVTQYAGAIGAGGPEGLPLRFNELADHYVGGWLGTSIELAVLADVIAVGVGFSAATSRGLFTLARDGLLPARLAEVNRENVPRMTTLVVAAAGVAVIIASLAVYGVASPEDGFGVATDPPDAQAAFEVAASAGAFVICVVYVLLCFGGILYFTFRERQPGAAVAGVVGLVAAGAGVVVQFTDLLSGFDEARLGRNIGLVLLGLVAAWVLGSMIFNGSAVRQAGNRAHHHEAA